MTAIAARWQELGRTYTAEVNAYLQRQGSARGEDLDAYDVREAYAERVLELLRAANHDDALTQFRAQFPPASEPLRRVLEPSAQAVTQALALEHDDVLVRLGWSYEDVRCYRVTAGSVGPLDGVLGIGCSRSGLYAAQRADCIELRSSFDGRPLESLAWRADDVALAPYPDLDQMPIADRLLPLPDGKRVVLVSSAGIFLVAPDRVEIVFPSRRELSEYADYLSRERSDDAPERRFDMIHAALSPDGSLLCVGEQSSDHVLLETATLAERARITPASEYAHQACFSADGEQLALNSCHMHHGETIGVSVSSLLGRAPGDDQQLTLDRAARVYCVALRGSTYLLGNAFGYVLAVDTHGEERWRHFVGGTITALGLTPDARQLVVGTALGTVHLIELDCAAADPFQIGTGTHREQLRWLWLDGQPLRW